MHNIDRTQLEMEGALETLQPESFEFTGESSHEQGEWEAALHEAGMHEGAFENEAGEGAFEGAHEGAFESYEGAFEGASHEGAFESGAFEAGETYGETSHESPLGEAEEMELASEFLEVTNQHELDQFLGKLIRRVARNVGRVVRSPIGRAIGGALRPLARAALPIAGRAFGTIVGGPLGGMVGGQLASAAGRMFGLELEGLSGEDREFEVARRFVRFGTRATRTALAAPATLDPVSAARTAIQATSRTFAPGLLVGAVPTTRPSDFYATGGRARRQGTWIRRGRRILLLGV